ncbi:RibD family protein [Limisphaera sp. 4302-co]|uniref:RibD family protein n=1 Tax=Limisphaera sp. 4302-co TaxID=3400417 RepID=UPI003C137E3E
MKAVRPVPIPSQAAGSRLRVMVNMAITADGKIATANRRIATFGSRTDHEHLLTLRATADAVLAGARTVESGPMDLGPGPERFRRLRLRRGLAEYNLRIIVSGSGSIAPDAHIFRKRFSPILILTTGRVPARRLDRLRRLADAVGIFGTDELDWPAALTWLYRDWGVRRLVCEGGGTVNDSLFRAGLVDELHLTVCPFVVGGRHAPTIADGRGFPNLAAAARFQLVRRRRIGDEIFLHFTAQRP